MLYNISLQKHKESSSESGIVIEFAVIAFPQKWVGKVKTGRKVKVPGYIFWQVLRKNSMSTGSNSSTFRR